VLSPTILLMALWPLYSIYANRPEVFGPGWFLWLPMALMHMIGFTASLCLVDVWGKPLAFCLPGHHAVTFRLLWCLGGLSGLLSLILLRGYPAPEYPRVTLFAVFFLSLNVVAYWLGVRSAGPFKLTGWFEFIFLMGFLSCLLQSDAVEKLMVNPGAMILLSAVSWCVTAWIVRKLGRRQVVRDVCLNAEAVVKGQMKDEDSSLGDVLHRWFCQKITCQSKGFFQQFWALLYLTVRRFVLGWKTLLTASLLLVLFMGYTRPIGHPKVVVMVCLAVSMMSVLIARESFCFTTAGRMQRFWAVVIGGVTLQGCTVFWLFGLILLSHAWAWTLPAMISSILPWFQPSVPTQGESYGCHSMAWWILLYPLVMMPVLIGLAWFFERHVLRYLFVCLIVLAFFWTLLCAHNSLTDLISMTPGVYGFLVVLSYCVLLAGAYWPCFKKDLLA